MGYHVAILRTAAGVPSPILSSELSDATRAVSGWSLTQGETPTLTYSPNGEEIVSLWHTDGELWAKNPSDEGLSAMIALAEQLEARVRGDELETYRTPTSSYVHPDDRAAVNES